MALVPPVGYRSEWGSLLAFLKLAQGIELSIDASDLDFFDVRGRLLESWHNAFGFTTGMQLDGPYSEKLADDRRRPAAASLARWRLNSLLVETNLVTSQPDSLRVVYLPLQVPLPNDHHIIVSIVNLGKTPLNIATGMHEAICWADGVAYESIAARVWNGIYLIRPGHATTRLFRSNDFPGIPCQGTREMSLEILGMRSVPQTVTWCGEPFLNSNPVS
jgi:hypothetical protein